MDKKREKTGRKLECDEQKISNRKVRNLEIINVDNDRNLLFRSNVYENKFVNVAIKNANFQKTLFSNSVFNNVDFSNASLDSCQFIDCKFKEVVGIESINASGLILKYSLSSTRLSDAESIKKNIFQKICNFS